jgi:uncharacterized damage-inducible protein DinB
MNTIDTIEYSLNSSNMFVHAYVDDLSPDDWMVRPTEGANHLAWQFGHLLTATKALAEACFPGELPELPEGFGEKYTTETSSSDNPEDFHSVDELIALYEAQRQALLKAVAGLSEDDLVKPAPENLEQIAKTVGEVCEFQALHWMMHAGQWAIIRRKLGHPAKF